MQNRELADKVSGRVKACQRFFRTQKTKPVDFRIRQLKRLYQAIKDRKQEIADALQKDLHKSNYEAYTTEVGYTLQEIRVMIQNLHKWTKEKKVMPSPYVLPARAKIVYEPYGVVLVIAPFNYPFQLLMAPLAGAIAAGNCVVVKTSELAPQTSFVIMEILRDIFPSKYVYCIEGGVEVSEVLLRQPFEYIFFTGSVRVGKIVMKQASDRLVPVTLELGGKSPVIVDETADLKSAAKRIIWGKLINAGQTCIAPDYLLVHESVKDELLLHMKLAIRQFYGTDILKNKDYGRIVNREHFLRIKKMLDEEREHIYVGGNTLEEECYIEPSIIVLENKESVFMQEELFGPVLPVLTYKKLREAVDVIFSMSDPLALYLFTGRQEVKDKIVAGIPAGGVCINGTIEHIVSHRLPFGGRGNSGMGSYHGRESFLTFSHKKSVLEKSSRFTLPVMYPPYNENMLSLIEKFYQ